MTHEQARGAIRERFESAQVSDSGPLVVVVPVEQWLAFARFARARGDVLVE